MKVLIWIVCLFVAGFLQVFLKVFINYEMGGIPTFLFFGAFFALAKLLCSQWDKRKASREQNSNQQNSNTRSEQENDTTISQLSSTRSASELQANTDNNATISEDLIDTEVDDLPVQITIENDTSGELVDSSQNETDRIVEIAQEKSYSFIKQENELDKSEESIPLRVESDSVYNEETKLPPIRFCLKCGFELLPGSVFCSKCGARIPRE